MNGWQRGISLFVMLFTAVLASNAWGAVIGITSSQPLVFGKFVAGTGGSIIVSTSGARSPTGNVVLLSSGSGSAAQFNITGDASVTYAITLPADNTVSLTDNSSHTMGVTSFISDPAVTGTLSGGGTATLTVGATLVVNNAQVTGEYSGSFDVTVNYN